MFIKVNLQRDNSAKPRGDQKNPINNFFLFEIEIVMKIPKLRYDVNLS